MSVFNNNLLLGAGGQAGGAVFDPTLIPNSVWLDGSADLLSKSFSGSASATEGVYSMWVQRTGYGTDDGIFGTYGTIDSATKELMFAFQESNKIQIYWFQGGGPGLVLNYITTRVFRDIGWYHILFSYKTDESGAGDRAKLFINGIEETAYDTKTNPSASYAPPRPFASVPFGIGVTGETGAINSDFLDGYIAQSTFLDGHSIQGGDVAITDFLDTFTYGTNGSQFVPKANSDVAGLASAAGANSFCLDFANSSDLGNDISSKGNDFSLTSMAAANQSTHTPSLTYLQFNPLQKFGTAALSEGNTRVGVDVYDAIRGTKFVSTGKKYLEITVNTVNNTYIGVANGSSNPSSFASSNVACLQKSGDIYINDAIPSGQSARSKAVATGDVIGILIDADAKKFWQSVDGTINSLDRNNSITVSDSDVLAGTGGFDLSGLTGDDGNYTIHIGNSDGTSADVSINGGHKDFSHTPPTGYLGWGSDNYTAPEFQGIDYFDSTLYEGNGSGQRVGDFVPFTDAFNVAGSAMFQHNEGQAGIARAFKRTIGTPSSSGGKKGTWSVWYKTALIDTDNIFFDNGTTATTRFSLQMDASGQITFSHGGTSILVTNADLKGGGFWRNLVLRVDTSQSTATDRALMYIDGVLVTSFATDGRASLGLNAELGYMDPGATQFVGTFNGVSANQWDGYLAETVFLDNQFLTASSFGQLDTATNKWVPKAVTGLTFGDQGFYLKYATSFTSIAGGTGTALGNATANGGLSASFDGTILKAAAQCSRYQASSPTDGGLVGKDWGSGTTNSITSVFVTGSTDQGFQQSVVNNVTLVLEGSTDNFSGSVVALGSNTIYDDLETQAIYPSITTAFRYHRVKVTASAGSGSQDFYYAQIVFNTAGNPGTDSSGEGNNFLPIGSWIPETLFIDSPTKNFAIFDPSRSGGGSNTWFKGATTVIGTDGSLSDSSVATFGQTSGKVVFDYKVITVVSGYPKFGFVTSLTGVGAISATSGSIELGAASVPGGFSYSAGGVMSIPNNSEATTFSSVSSLTALDADDVIRFEIDLDIGSVKVFIQNEGSGSFAEETGARVTNWPFTSFGLIPAVSNFNSSQVQLLTGGQTTLASVTTDFLELNQDNLDDTQSKLTAWAWIKNRDAADNHILIDRVRGVGNDLHSNDPAAEAFNANTVQRFLQRGVQVGSDVEVNTASESYVLWQWLLGDSATTGSTNDDGSVDTTVIAADAGHFSIVKGTTGGSGATFGHGLGAAPDFIINKDLTSAGWLVYSSAFASVDNYIQLNATSSVFTGSTVFGTAPTSTVFTLASFFNTVECINYCFRSVPGVCKVGGYIGNGSADGPYVSLGFTPRWVMIKKTSGTGSWNLYDTARSPINEVDDQLLADSTAAETTGSEELDIIADGFKIRTADSGVNTSSGTYIYLAMADIGGNGTLPPIYSR
jgi:hypothetical protein